MKQSRIISIIFLSAFFAAGSLEAQNFKGMSLNGSTGLYSIPTGTTGWDTSSFGLDFGYHTIIRDSKATHIPKIAVSLFKWVELSAAFDFQPEGYSDNDFLGGVKIQFPLKKTALAIGGNYQALNLSGDGSARHDAGQVYIATSYSGRFFDMPAETTVVLGKTFGSGVNNWDIDFGMGFNMVLFPNQLGGILHWIVDISNFSYSIEAYGADPFYRGVLNIGLRFDLSQIKPLNKFKFLIDVFLTDAFDEGRGFSLGAVFGLPIL